MHIIVNIPQDIGRATRRSTILPLPHWDYAQEKDLAEQLALIVTGRLCAHQKEDGSWTLGETGNWVLKVTGNKNDLCATAKLISCKKYKKTLLEAYKQVIVHRLGIEEYNV